MKSIPKIERSKVKAHLYFKMAVDTTATGIKTKLMEEDDLFCLKEATTKDSFRMVCMMVMVYLLTLKVQNIKGSGSKVCNPAKELKSGKMVQILKVNLWKVKNKEEVCLSGPMDVFMPAC